MRTLNHVSFYWDPLKALSRKENSVDLAISTVNKRVKVQEEYTWCYLETEKIFPTRYSRTQAFIPKIKI